MNYDHLMKTITKFFPGAYLVVYSFLTLIKVFATKNSLSGNVFFSSLLPKNFEHIFLISSFISQGILVIIIISGLFGLFNKKYWGWLLLTSFNLFSLVWYLLSAIVVGYSFFGLPSNTRFVDLLLMVLYASSLAFLLQKDVREMFIPNNRKAPYVPIIITALMLLVFNFIFMNFITAPLTKLILRY